MAALEGKFAAYHKQEQLIPRWNFGACVELQQNSDSGMCQGTSIDTIQHDGGPHGLLSTFSSCQFDIELKI